MKTEPNIGSSKKFVTSKALINDSLIEYINTLSDSIREYYKVSKNVNKNKSMLINLVETEINKSKLILNDIFNKKEINENDINSFNTIIVKIIDIFGKIKLNISSEDNNLIYFFEDAKILFKKMKEKRQEIIMKMKKRCNSTSRGNYSSTYASSQNNINVNYRKINPNNKNKNERFLQSEINTNIRNMQNLTSEFNIINKSVRYTNMNNNLSRTQKSKTLNKNKGSINDEFFENIELKQSNSNIKNNENYDTEVILKIKNAEIEKLKSINQKISLELKRYKNKLLEIGSNNDITLTKESNSINNVSQEKDKIISSLKEDITKNKKKNIELMTNIKKLQDENNKLKNKNLQKVVKLSNNQELENNLNNLIAENNMLKINLEKYKLKSNNVQSEYNYSVNMKKDLSFDNKTIEKENDLLKKKISNTEKKLIEKEKQNKELNYEMNNIKNKYELQLSQLTEKNSELTSNLTNKQTDLLNLQKENLTISQELEKFKKSLINSKENQKIFNSNDGINYNNKANINKINTSGEVLNKTIEKFKSENEQLKTNNNIYQDKIKYYQTQIRNIKNELYEKNKDTIELKNNTQQQIKELKDKYEKIISEINEKNKSLESSLEECQTFNSDLSQQICNLNQQIVAKDVKILELNYQIEQIQNNLASTEEENKKLLKKIEESNNNISKIETNKDSNINETISKLNEKIEEQQNINNDLNEELIKIRKDNDLLKNKILSNDRRITDYKNKEINQENVQELNNKIENLQKENLSLKENNKKLTCQLEDSQKQKEENEGFKQLITKLQSEKENHDEEINNLKRENEKIKNQIIRLSKKLPEEFNDLQKQYNELENKYLQQIKSKSNKSTPNKSKKSQVEIETNEEKLTNELKEAKKEIEIIKKKNLELVSQLEEKEIRKNCYDNKSEGGNMSNYEEEFDLRKMAKGAKDKNRSQDINIDYPGVQAIKDKYRELDFYYNSLEGLVKKLLLTIQCNPKNKTYVAELCRIVGFDLETTNKILNNKNKKLILGLFSK